MADIELNADIMEERGAQIASKLAAAIATALLGFVSTTALSAALDDYKTTTELSAILENYASADDLAAVQSALTSLGADATLRVIPKPAAGVDQGATINATIAAAVSGDTILFAPGVHRSSVRTLVDPTGKSLKILGYNAIVEYDNGQHGFTVKPTWSTRQSFSSMSSDGLIIYGVPDVTLFRDKDFITLTSSEVDQESAHAPSSCQGEDLFLENIQITSGTAGNLILMRPSGVKSGERLPYTTNPKVSQRAVNKVEIEGLTIQHKASVTDTPWVGNGSFELLNLTFPIIRNVRVPFAIGPTWVHGCIGASITNCVFGRHPDTKYTSPAPVIVDDFATYGYHISCGSLGTTVVGCQFFRGRHAITTSDKAYGSGSTDPGQYGGSVGLTVTASIAYGCTDDAMGTHHRSRSTVFEACGVVDCYKYAYQIRSQAEVRNCWSRNCFGTWHAFDEKDRVPALTWARIVNYTSNRDGAANNSCHVTPVYVAGYHWLEGQRNNPGWIAQSFDDCVTDLTGGLSTIQPAATTMSSGNALIGQNTKGTIRFGIIDFDVSKTQANLGGYGIDCRGNGSATYNWTFVGQLIRVRGANVGAMFNAVSGNYPSKAQMRFAMCFEPNVATWSGALQSNSTYIQVNRNNDLNGMGGAHVIYMNDALSGLLSRVETFTGGTGLNFGVMAAGETKSVLVDVMGYKSGDIIMPRFHTTNAALVFEKVHAAADNKWQIWARNVTSSSGTFNGVTATVIAERL